MSGSKAKTTDAVEILRRRFVQGDAEMEALVRQERDNLEVAQQLYDLRSAVGLTQQQLADLVGTTAAVICRLEDADYEGHSLSLLRRVARALKRRVEVRFVPLGEEEERPSRAIAPTGQSTEPILPRPEKAQEPANRRPGRTTRSKTARPDSN